MVSRRSYLTTLAVVGLAGCVGNPSGSAIKSSSETATTPSSTPSRPELTIEAAAVQYSYRYGYNADEVRIRVPDGQFVMVTVDASEVEQAIDREAFSLVTSEEQYDEITIDYEYPQGLDVPGDLYMDKREGIETKPRGWIAFDVPAQLDREPSLRVETDTGSWEWELDTGRATAPPPAWDWTASAPETVTVGEPVDITVTVENTGDGHGKFRGAVQYSFPLYAFKSFDNVLDPGESGESVVSIRTDNADPGDVLTYVVRTPTGTSEVSVAVESGQSSTSTESST
jgi:hypothetical protein